MSHGPHGHQQPPPRRTCELPPAGLLFSGMQVGSEVVDALHGHPEGRGDRQSRAAHGGSSPHDRAQRQRQGHGRRLRRCEGQPSASESAHRGRGGELHRNAAIAAQLRHEQVSRRVGQQLGSSRPPLHAPHDGLRVRDLRAARQHVPRNDPGRGFVGGYEMETISLGLPFFAAFLSPGAWGSDFAYWMDNYSHVAGMWLVGEDMPRETNRVTLNTDVKDQFGLPVPNVHYDDHPNDIALRNHAYRQGERVYEAVGAIKTMRTPPYPSTHNLGTCRMSADPKLGVVNKHGQSHDIPNLFISDGSQYTTGAAENPTLTIVTLAIRQADYIAD